MQTNLFDICFSIHCLHVGTSWYLCLSCIYQLSAFIFETNVLIHGRWQVSHELGKLHVAGLATTIIIKLLFNSISSFLVIVLFFFIFLVLSVFSWAKYVHRVMLDLFLRR